MDADIVAYGLLASIFVVHGLRMWIDKPTAAGQRSALWLERFKKRTINRSSRP